LRALLASLMLLLSPFPASAWNDAPHLVIAQIAYLKLEQPAAAKVTKAAGLLEHRGVRYTNITIGAYMDDVRADPFYDYLRPLHFFSKPWTADGVALPTEPAEGQANLVIGLKIIGALREGVESEEMEAQYIAYLIHLVGDAHQPLHCIDRYTKELPDGDAGGNRFYLQGPNKSLHSFWDSAGRMFTANVSRPLGPGGSAAIRDHADSIMREYPDKAVDLKKTEVEAWVDESYQLAQDDAYAGIAENSLPSLAYRDKVRRISRQRMAEAGYRLAALLNDMYGKPVGPTQQKPQPQPPTPRRRSRRAGARHS